MGESFVNPTHKHRYVAPRHSDGGRGISFEGNTREVDADYIAELLKGKTGTRRDPRGGKFNFPGLLLGIGDKLFDRLPGSWSRPR